MYVKAWFRAFLSELKYFRSPLLPCPKSGARGWLWKLWGWGAGLSLVPSWSVFWGLLKCETQISPALPYDISIFCLHGWTCRPGTLSSHAGFASDLYEPGQFAFPLGSVSPSAQWKSGPRREMNFISYVTLGPSVVARDWDWELWRCVQVCRT